MKSARGVQGFIRYWGPENGGINEPNRAAYGALLRVFLDAKSLRWFFDTFLTAGNILILLGQYSPEVKNGTVTNSVVAIRATANFQYIYG